MCRFTQRDSAAIAGFVCDLTWELQKWHVRTVNKELNIPVCWLQTFPGEGEDLAKRRELSAKMEGTSQLHTGWNIVHLIQFLEIIREVYLRFCLYLQ